MAENEKGTLELKFPVNSVAGNRYLPSLADFFDVNKPPITIIWGSWKFQF